ncbi:MAG: hypothetical protein DDT31_00236 [Syntrophomonadaceae bacterium]|nr:hypothetical protein [Bacillota bacterium]
MDTKPLLDKHGRPSSRRLHQPGIFEQLQAATPWLLPEAKHAERLYVLHHGFTDYPKRCLCGTPLTSWRSWGGGYIGEHCSTACYNKERATKSAERKAALPPKVLLPVEELKIRREASNLARYGVRYPCMREDFKQQKAKAGYRRLAVQWQEELRQGGISPRFDINAYQGNRTWVDVQCSTCSTSFKIQRLRWIGNSNLCPTCYTPRASRGQHEVADWVRSLGVMVRVNDRKMFKGKMELDIFVPEKQLVIEYDGLYWHSEKGRPDTKKKSAEKLIALKAAGLKHIMVFDDEWELKRPIVESRIRNALGCVERKVAARHCEVVEVTRIDATEFMRANHLQGNVAMHEAIGLRFDNELVAVMTFGASRFNSTLNWELLRFATKTGTSVVGGASRIFSTWRRKHAGASIVSFSDNRWGTGNFYTHLGFTNDGQTGQGYFYINSNGQRRSRQQHMKHKLKNALTVFDPSLTERENCWNNGWYRVWDLGNTRWVIK